MRRKPEYQDPPLWIAGNAWERGHIEPFELARIAAWKSARSVAAVTVNRPGEIEFWTRAAISVILPWRNRRAATLTTDADWAGWQKAANTAIGWVGRPGELPSGLLSLTGVGYPVASAILDTLDPEMWPVMDRWAARSVFGVVPSRYCATRYAAYARHLAVEGVRHWGAELSIHELDMKAQAASMKGGQLPVGWQFTQLPPSV